MSSPSSDRVRLILALSCSQSPRPQSETTLRLATAQFLRRRDRVVPAGLRQCGCPRQAARCRPPRCLRHLDPHADNADLLGAVVLRLNDHFVCQHLLVLHDLIQGVHRRGGHPRMGPRLFHRSLSAIKHQHEQQAYAEGREATSSAFTARSGSDSSIESSSFSSEWNASSPISPLSRNASRLRRAACKDCW
jgi:hypothetical protein